jgi:hypothetical protein
LVPDSVIRFAIRARQMATREVIGGLVICFSRADAAENVAGRRDAPGLLPMLALTCCR